MDSLLKFEQGSCQLSSMTCRRHAHAQLVHLCEWAAEAKPCIRPPAVIDLGSKYRKADQSTVSFCALIFFTFSVFLFIVSAIDYSLLGLLGAKLDHGYDAAAAKVGKISHSESHIALRGLGTVYRSGSRAMSELIVAHLGEETSADHFRLFIRTLHRSGAMARADLVVLFPSTPPDSYVHVLQEENGFFRQLVSHRLAAELKLSSLKNNHSSSGRGLSAFNFGAYRKAAEESQKPSKSLWGSSPKTGASLASEVAFPAGESDGILSAAVSWGSIVGFEAAELNPEDALRGFIDGAGIQMRRWACYEMLLGKVRHRFRHVLAVGVEATLVLGDALAAARVRKAPYLLVALQEEGRRRRQRAGPEFDEKRRRAVAVSAAFAGSMKRMRELSAAMSVEIVRMALQRRTRGAFHDSAALSRLVHAAEKDEEFLSHQPFLLTLPGRGQPRRRSRYGAARPRHPIVHCSSAATFRRFAAAVWLGICSEAAAYPDCGAASKPNSFTVQPIY